MRTKRYTEQEFIDAVASSISIRELLIKLGLNPTGGNYKNAQSNISKLNLNVSHFKGQGHNKDKIFGPKRPIEDYLSNQFPITSDSLRRRLLKEGFFEHKCYRCNQTEWLGEPIPLELHHKDRNHTNNNLSNLAILCPNCHSLTHKDENNIKHTIDKVRNPRVRKTYTCACGQSRLKFSKLCKKCYQSSKSLKSKRPSKEQLLSDIDELLYFTTIGKKYNVSDNAVRKWFKFYNLEIPNNYHKVALERVELSTVD